ncbi:hypothetical protein RQP46_000952 [Phenoliferia psychrophenolica]
MSHRPGYTRENSLGNIPVADFTDSVELASISDSKRPVKDKDHEAGVSAAVYEVEHDPEQLDLENEDIDDKNEKVMETAYDFSTKLKSLDDDPTLPVSTFRIGQIYYFRPQTVYVSSLFITILSFVLGRIMAVILPGEVVCAKYFGARFGKPLGRFLNPGPFNVKEHAIEIMSSTAVSSATAISVFATDELYYSIEPNYGVAIFAMIGSQLLGYGLAGFSRSYTVFPTFAVWPSSFAYTQLFETLHSKHQGGAMLKRWRFFWILLGVIFVWTLTGISIMCLARQDSEWVTRLFGGSNGNEGFGMFSMSFDWYYVTLILTANYDLNQTALDIQGIPWYSMTNALSLAGNNLATGSQISFVILFYHKQIYDAWKQFRTNTQMDPHYQFGSVPMWWYGAILLGSFAMAMATCYTGHSHLPWWALIVAILFSSVTMPFVAVIGAVTGFSVGFGNAVGTVIGGILQIIMTKTIIANQREILLSAGTAKTFKATYGAGSTYQMIPICLAIGFIIPFIVYGAHRLRPTWGFDKIIVPYVSFGIDSRHVGKTRKANNSTDPACGISGTSPQLYIRKKHPGDGGYQFMSFIGTFAGGAGTAHPFPAWAVRQSLDLENFQALINCKYIPTS